MVCLIVTWSINSLVALAAPQEPLADTGRSPVELLVSVRSGKDMAAERGAAVGSAHYHRDESQEQENAPRQVRRYQTPSRATTRQVRVLEGHVAYIGHNESAPYPAAFSDDGPGRRYPYYEIEYRDLQQGFAVRPHFSGDQLLLDISSRSDSWSTRGGSIMDSTVIQTTISAELGLWIRLGGVDKPLEKKPGTYSLPKSVTNEGKDEIWVRVERLD